MEEGLYSCFWGRRAQYQHMPLTPSPIAEQAAKVLGITDLVPAIYEDLLKPAAQEMGKNLIVVAQAVSIALAPLELGVWGYQRIKNWLSAKVAAKLADKPPEQIKAPDLVIAGPVVTSMIFAADAPHLRELYANLLAAAMYAPTAGKAHPSFVQLIQQLSPSEALILQEISRNGFAVLEEVRQIPGGISQKMRPMLESLWFSLCEKCGITDSLLVRAFYNNFIRLGILAERFDARSHVLDGGMVAQLEVGVSDYGRMFLEVCIGPATE